MLNRDIHSKELCTPCSSLQCQNSNHSLHLLDNNGSPDFWNMFSYNSISWSVPGFLSALPKSRESFGWRRLLFVVAPQHLVRFISDILVNVQYHYFPYGKYCTSFFKQGKEVLSRKLVPSIKLVCT